MADAIQQAYKNDFEKFLAHTNEKEILRSEIIREIEKKGATSFLDIGAGNGLLSIPLAARVKRYLAVESKDSFVNKLRAAGLDAVHADFPTRIEERFDMVLSSHSMSYSPGRIEPFIRTAWESVAPGGELLVVTFRGQEDDWTRLMKELGEDPVDKHRGSYNDLIMLLNSLGEVKTRKIKSTIQTETLDDMIEALSFVASDGKPEKKEEFMRKKAILEKRLLLSYKTSSGFEFPFWHHFISTHRALPSAQK